MTVIVKVFELELEFELQRDGCDVITRHTVVNPTTMLTQANDASSCVYRHQNQLWRYGLL